VTDDIVTRLLSDSVYGPHDKPLPLNVEAADEIERLRDLAYKLEHDLTCRHSFCSLCGAGIAEWDDYKEARRG
jgi:hypothetical protein